MTPRQSPGVLSRMVDDALVIYDPEADVVHTLNETARFIWTQCDGNCSSDAIADALCRDFDVDEETARRDVERVLKRFVEQGLIEEPK